MDRDRPGERPPNFWRSRFGIGWLALAGVAGWFLWTEHRAHLFDMLAHNAAARLEPAAPPV